MSNTKIIIVGQHNIDKLAIAKQLILFNEELEIAGTFISDKLENYNNAEYLYQMDTDKINLCYKNNALLYVHNINSKEYIIKGITLDSFYNSDIFCMDIEDFNNISDNIFIHNDIIVIWVDTKNTKNMEYDELYNTIHETKYLMDRLPNINYMYFLDEDNEKIAKTILQYLEADDNIRKEILNENE